MEKFLEDELLVLLEKARAGNATGDDYARIAAIINTDQTGELIALADNFLAQETPVSSQHITPYNYDYWQQAFLEIKEAWQQKNTVPAKVRPLSALRRWWWAAASIMLLLSAGTYLLVKTKTPKHVAVSTTTILPGKEGAILTLANGSRISLDSIQNGVVAMQGGTTVKIVNGTLQYEGKGSEAVYNVMSTPKARKFHVILPDGTNAWLNSASSIQYPTAFTGSERKVAITGEVYFEVASLIPAGESHKVPFIVNINNQAEIEVLGTHFNVKAYDNEPVINTTLLEGMVRITLPTGRQARNAERVTLHPGQQAQILVNQQKMLVDGAPAKDDAAKKMPPGVTVLNNTDMDKVMAWKNGVFDFNNIAFADAMHQLERWYDIQVVYEKGIPADIELSGKMTKDIPLNDLVTILEKIGVRCRLEGRKLLIQS